MSTNIDYKSLLTKYMDHVVICEGTSFLGDLSWTNLFNEEEATELKKIGNYPYPTVTGPLARDSKYSERLKELLAEEIFSMPVTKQT